MDLPVVSRSEHRKLVRFFAILPALLGAITAIVGILSLSAWIAGQEDLTSLVTESMPIAPVTAVCLILAGAALIVAQKTTRPFVFLLRAFAAIIGVIGLWVLIAGAFRAAPDLDTWIFTMLGDKVAGHKIRHMGLNTAASFVFLALGMMFLPKDRANRQLKSQVFATLSLIVSFLALVGHMFGVTDFYHFTWLAGMALVTAIALTLLGAGLLFCQLDRGVPALIVDDGAAGHVARRLIPGVVVVPFSLAMLRLAGEARGMDKSLGASLGSVANMVVFLLLVAWSARVLRETDAKRVDLYRREREARDAAEKAREDAEAATQQAEAARNEAESANGAKSDFLAVMSHELRTPLAAIMGYQELLADGITGPITEQQGQQLGRIKASARHLLSLIDEILTFTRLDAGRETVLLDKFDVEGAMNQAAEIAEPLAHTKKLELKLIPPPTPVLLESDPTKVRQILVNLLSNAVKFTDTGTVTLEGRALKNEVQFLVSDTGIGIQPDNLNRIFDPFWQVEQKATRRATGTGLGLTVSRRLANLMGGDVAVTSQPGEGTTFTVTLPMKAPHIAAVVPVSTAHLRVG